MRHALNNMGLEHTERWCQSYNETHLIKHRNTYIAWKHKTCYYEHFILNEIAQREIIFWKFLKKKRLMISLKKDEEIKTCMNGRKENYQCFFQQCFQTLQQLHDHNFLSSFYSKKKKFCKTYDAYKYIFSIILQIEINT